MKTDRSQCLRPNPVCQSGKFIHLECDIFGRRGFCPVWADVSATFEHSLHAVGRAWGTLHAGIPIALWANTLRWGRARRMTAGRWAKAPAGERPDQDGALGTMHGKSCVLKHLLLEWRATCIVPKGEAL